MHRRRMMMNSKTSDSGSVGIVWDGTSADYDTAQFTLTNAEISEYDGGYVMRRTDSGSAKIVVNSEIAAGTLKVTIQKDADATESMTKDKVAFRMYFPVTSSYSTYVTMTYKTSALYRIEGRGGDTAWSISEANGDIYGDIMLKISAPESAIGDTATTDITFAFQTDTQSGEAQVTTTSTTTTGFNNSYTLYLVDETLVIKSIEFIPV